MEPGACRKQKVSPAGALKAEDGVVRGECVVPLAGTLSVTFDNAHSRLTSTQVTYTITVTAPATPAQAASAAPRLQPRCAAMLSLMPAGC